jgi:hypothetical protein
MTRLAAIIILLAVTYSFAKDSPLACKTRRDLVGACHMVHGRLMFYNGTPSFRIWIVGTNRLLGVHEIEFGDNSERPLMPERIVGLAGMEHEVYADFDVCPLTKQEPRTMQMVCVASARHVVTAPYGGARIKHEKPQPPKSNTH